MSFASSPFASTPFAMDGGDDRLTAFMFEHGHLTDKLTPCFVSYIREGGHFSEAYSYTRTSWMIEGGVFAEQYASLLHAFVAMLETGKFAENYSPVRAVMMADHGHFAEAYTAVRQYMMDEHLTAHEAYVPMVHALGIMAESLRATESYFSSRSTFIHEAMRAHEQYFIQRTTMMAEHGHFAEEYLIRSQLFALMQEHMKAIEVYTAIGTNLTYVMREDMCATEMYLLPGPNAGYSAPTDKFGMSRYDSLAVNEIAAVNGQLVGVGPAGLYWFDGQTDLGNAIKSSVTTSVWDGGKAWMKRPGYAYLGMLLELPLPNTDMQLAMTHFQDGPPTTIVYDPEPHVTGGYASMRFKLSRGLKTFYVQFTLSSNGGVWRLDDWRTQFDKTGRKV